jgi:hypothetical protein
MKYLRSKYKSGPKKVNLILHLPYKKFFRWSSKKENLFIRETLYITTKLPIQNIILRQTREISNTLKPY